MTNLPITIKEVEVTARAVFAMIEKIEEELAHPNPSWSAQDTRNHQYDLVLLTSSMNKLVDILRGNPPE